METSTANPASPALAHERARRLLRGRKWLAILVATMLLQLGAVLALNYVVDPRGEFPRDDFIPLVSNVRELKMLGYAEIDPRPESLIVGSSRAVTLSPDVLEETGWGPTYNFAVNSGKITDALYIYERAVAMGGTPTHLLLLVEDWSFRSPSQEARWPQPSLPGSGPLDLQKRLLASARADYVSDSVRSVKLHATGFPLREMAIQDDGSVRWEKADAAMAEGTYDRAAALTRLRDYARHFYREGFVPPETAYLETLETLLTAARENGTELHFALAPMTKEGMAQLDADAYLQALDATRALLVDACGAGVHVHDMSDPAGYGATDADFIDGYHPTREGGVLLTRAILRAPDLCQQEL